MKEAINKALAEKSGNTNASEVIPTLDDWFSFEEFEKETNGRFRANQIEWMYKCRDKNGFKPAFRKIANIKHVSKSIFERVVFESKI